jgi:hypothetical protein
MRLAVSLHHFVSPIAREASYFGSSTSSRDREGITSTTSLSTCRTSPGRAGLGLESLVRDSSSDPSLDNGLGLGSEVAADQAAHVTVSGLTLIGFRA